MPYIKQEDREDLVGEVEIGRYGSLERILRYENIKSAGDIQYLIAMIAKFYMETNGLNYQSCNDVMGALAGAQQEFYRRTVAPYEDKKIKENGDV